jgi:hypothetical protein
MYQANVCLTTEQLDWVESEQAYIGCNPDTFQDHGIVQTIKNETLEGLFKELQRQFTIKNWEVFEDRLEYQCDGEHHYNTPKADQIPFIETYSISISKVTHEFLTEEELQKLLKGAAK